jgi:hypothetical protein
MPWEEGGEILTEEDIFEGLRKLVDAGLVMVAQREPDGEWCAWLTPPGVIIAAYLSEKGNIPKEFLEIVANLYEEPNEKNAKAVRDWFKRTLGYVPRNVNIAVRQLLAGDKWGITCPEEIVLIESEDGQLEKYEIAAVVDADCWEIMSMWIVDKMKRG